MRYLYQYTFAAQCSTQFSSATLPPFESWLPNAKSQSIIDLSEKIVALYKGSLSGDDQNMVPVFVDFQIIWMEVIDRYIDEGRERTILDMFRNGGRVQRDLVGDQLAGLLQRAKAVLQFRNKYSQEQSRN